MPNTHPFQGTQWETRGAKTYIYMTCQHCEMNIVIVQPASYSMLPVDIFCPECGAQTQLLSPIREIEKQIGNFECRRCGKPAKWKGALCSECYRRYKFGKLR